MYKNYAFSVKFLKTASWEGNLATGSLIYPCISRKRNSAESQSSDTFLMCITDNFITQKVKKVMSKMATQDLILAKEKEIFIQPSFNNCLILTKDFLLFK